MCDISVMPTGGLMLTVEVTNMFIFDLWLMVSRHQLLTSVWCQFNICCSLGCYTVLRHVGIITLSIAWSKNSCTLLFESDLFCCQSETPHSKKLTPLESMYAEIFNSVSGFELINSVLTSDDNIKALLLVLWLARISCNCRQFSQID